MQHCGHRWASRESVACLLASLLLAWRLQPTRAGGWFPCDIKRPTHSAERTIIACYQRTPQLLLLLCSLLGGLVVISRSKVHYAAWLHNGSKSSQSASPGSLVECLPVSSINYPSSELTGREDIFCFLSLGSDMDSRRCVAPWLVEYDLPGHRPSCRVLANVH